MFLAQNENSYTIKSIFPIKKRDNTVLVGLLLFFIVQSFYYKADFVIPSVITS